MCGIAGFERTGASDRAIARILCDALAHRGPDAAWTTERMDFSLVQTRLAVIDLSEEVVYPMPNEAGDVWLVFNGEIYDHGLLRDDLCARGHRFRTRCDAEVVVHAYEEWGVDCFNRLNGMFAAALVDQRRRQVVLARDRFGIKPLVRTTRPPFAFSSDAMALVQAGLSAGHIDYDAIRAFVALHYVPPPGTGISGYLPNPRNPIVNARGSAPASTAYDAIRDESIPPERKTPTSTSAINWRRTAFLSAYSTSPRGSSPGVSGPAKTGPAH